MKIMPIFANQSGAYPPIQSWEGTAPPEGYVEVPEGMDLTGFQEHNGFVTLVIENGVVTSMTPNVEAWEAWKAAHPPVESEPEVPTEMEQLRADVDYISVMTGVTL